MIDYRIDSFRYFERSNAQDGTQRAEIRSSAKGGITINTGECQIDWVRNDIKGSARSERTTSSLKEIEIGERIGDEELSQNSGASY